MTNTKKASTKISQNKKHGKQKSTGKINKG